MAVGKFAFARPTSVGGVLDLLGRHGAGANLIAGGTDLMVQIKEKKVYPEIVVSLLGIPELSGINGNGYGLRIGALVRHCELEGSPLLLEGLEILAAAAHKVGSPQIRNLGTLGGNVCNASPAADTAPPLLVLGAEAVLSGSSGERRVPLEKFFTGPGTTAMAQGEIMKEILVPKPPAGSVGAFLKMGRRKALDLALVSAAVLLTVSPAGVCERARVALGAVNPTPLRSENTERFLAGKKLDEAAIRGAAAEAEKECSPISDLRSSADYRREMVRVLVERAIRQALGMAIPPTGI